MIIYNKTWLTNMYLIRLVEREHLTGSVTGPELAAIKQKYPVGFYCPNLFVRAGLFAITCIITTFSCALLTLLFSDPFGIPVDYRWFLLLALTSYIILEIIVRRQHHHKSGVDNALLWTSFGLFVWAYLLATKASPLFTETALAIYVFAISLILAIRFSDRLMSLVSYLAIYVAIFYAWQAFYSLAIFTLPFILILFSAVGYILTVHLLTKNFSLFYSGCLLLLQASTLITLYASGNYYLVNELGNMLTGTKGDAMPLVGFFIAWTTIVPLVYIYGGLLYKDATLLRTGLLLCLASACTFWYYHHQLDLELALIIAGAFLLLTSWYLTRYLKTPKHGLTYQDLSIRNVEEELKIESLIISGSASAIHSPADNVGTQLGGGKFGGGGASTGF